MTQVEDAFGSGFLMDLNDKGKCVVTVDGTKSYGKWTLNGGAFQLDCGGLNCTGTLQDEILTLNDVQGQGVTLYFVKSGSTMQQPMDGDNMTQGTTAGSDTDVGIYVLESASDSEYTLSKEELALVDMEDFYIELRADGTGETYMEDFVTFQWKDGNFYALTDPDTPAMTYTREGDLLTIEFDGMTMVFKRSDTKPEIDPALLDGGDDEYDGTDEPDPPYTYDDGNTYADLGNTNWYGWFRMENYKNVPNRDYFDTDTYDCWGYIGESEDGSTTLRFTVTACPMTRSSRCGSMCMMTISSLSWTAAIGCWISILTTAKHTTSISTRTTTASRCSCMTTRATTARPVRSAST